jgi:hypothetical protein
VVWAFALLAVTAVVGVLAAAQAKRLRRHR